MVQSMVFKHPRDFGDCVTCRCFIMSWNAAYPCVCPYHSLKALHMSLHNRTFASPVASPY